MRIAPLFELGPWVLGLAMSLVLAGSCVALPLAVAFRLTRGGSARARYWIALVAFAAATILPVAAVLPEAPSRAGELAQSRQSETWQSAKVSRFTANAALASAVDSPLSALAPVLWLSISLVLLVREAVGHGALARRRRRWTPVSEEWRQKLEWPAGVPLFNAGEGPSTQGLLRPVVVLPLDWLATLPCSAAVCVARHELAHARRRDPLINALVRTVRAVLWPAAPLWLLERMIRGEREAAADVAAVSLHGGDAIVDYASSLLAAASRTQRRQARRIATAFHQGSSLEDRLGRLLCARPVSRLRFLAAAAITAAGALSVAAIPLASVPPWKPRPLSVAATASPSEMRATRALNEILASTRFHDHTRSPAVKSALARFTASGTAVPLLGMLRTRDARTRECAAWIAGAVEDSRAVEGLITAVSDHDPHVRQTAAWALGKIGDRRAAKPLRELARTTWSPELRGQAERSLAALDL